MPEPDLTDFDGCSASSCRPCEEPDELPLTDGTTYDYTRRLWGHDCTILEVVDGGQQLRCSGWGPCLDTGPLRQIQRGDYLILRGERQGSSTRYQVTEIEYYRDPDDMWTATLQFAPRNAALEAS